MLSSDEQLAWAVRMDAEGEPGDVGRSLMMFTEALSAARYELLLFRYDDNYHRGAVATVEPVPPND